MQRLPWIVEPREGVATLSLAGWRRVLLVTLGFSALSVLLGGFVALVTLGVWGLDEPLETLARFASGRKVLVGVLAALVLALPGLGAGTAAELRGWRLLVPVASAAVGGIVGFQPVLALAAVPFLAPMIGAIVGALLGVAFVVGVLPGARSAGPRPPRRGALRTR
jgi:hypothetical protein